MAASAQAQFYTSYLSFGGLMIPIYPGARLSAPRNYVAPPLVGNFWILNEGDGFTNPSVDVQVAVRDVAQEALGLTGVIGVGSKFLDYALIRSADSANDTAILPGGVVFYNGVRALLLENAKFDSFSLSASKGGDITMRARFCGTDVISTTTPSLVPWSTARLLRYNKVTFAGALAGIVWSVDAGFSNSHSPDMSMNGTTGPAAQNAGMLGATLQLTGQAADDATMGGISTAAFTIAGSNVTRTFTFGNVHDQTPDDLSISIPRNMREHSYLCKGVDGSTSGPLVVS